MPFSRHNLATGTPLSAGGRIAKICGTVYLLFFIQNILVFLAAKILFTQPHSFGGDWQPTPLRHSAVTIHPFSVRSRHRPPTSGSGND